MKWYRVESPWFNHTVSYYIPWVGSGGISGEIAFSSDSCWFLSLSIISENSGKSVSNCSINPAGNRTWASKQTTVMSSTTKVVKDDLLIVKKTFGFVSFFSLKAKMQLLNKYTHKYKPLTEIENFTKIEKLHGNWEFKIVCSLIGTINDCIENELQISNGKKKGISNKRYHHHRQHFKWCKNEYKWMLNNICRTYNI